MRISTNVSKTARKTIYVDNFEGVDARGLKDLQRSAKTSNLLSVDGKIVKRNGWKEEYKLPNKIDALTSVVLNGVEYVLVYSGKRFYLLKDKTVSDITESGSEETRVEADKLVDRPLTFFKKEGVYYIIGAGEYLSLGDFGNGIELRSVKKYAYIPTTTIGIMPEGKTIYVVDKTIDDSSRGVWYVKTSSGYVSVALTDEKPWNPEETYYNRVASYQMPPVKMEESNVLTPWRKNTLFGVNSGATYQLDSKNIERTKDTRIKLKVLELGEINEYTLKESASGNLLRSLEKGDNLKSKTITVSKNEEPIFASGLQNGMTVRGKTMLLAKNVECYWVSSGIVIMPWAKATLIFKVTNSEGVSKEYEIADAVRNGLYGSYAITYRDTQITIPRGEDVIVQEISPSYGFGNQVKAMLPSSYYHLLDQNLTEWGGLDHNTGKLTFIKATTSPDGGDNIEVTFSVSDNKYSAHAIDNTTIGIEYGVDGNTDRLFLTGNSELQNLDFASDSDDFTYFPMDYVYAFGLDGTPITGYQRLSDDSLAVFKDSFADESNLFIRRGKYVTKSVEVGENTFTFKKAEFTLSGSYLSNSSINGRLNKVFDGEPIFLTRRGIYTLKSNLDLMNERKSAVNRGVAVDGFILQNIEEVKDAIIFKNDYYLQVGKVTYIAKSNSYFTANGVKQYNWWVYENVPACTFAVINDELWFGNDEGRICRFYDGHSDIYFDEIESGNLLFEEKSPFVSFSERLKFRRDDRIILDGDVFASLFENVSLTTDKKVQVPETLGLGEIEVYADNCSGCGLSVDVPYQIKNVNTSDNTFELYQNGEKVKILKGGFRLSICLRNMPIKVDDLRFSLDASANDICTFTCYQRKVLPIKYNNEPIPVSLTAKIVREVPVIALWKTPFSDLNAPTMLKNVHSVGVDLGENTRGPVRILVSGKHSLNMYNNKWDMIDFAYPDLMNFVFSGKGEKSLYADTRFRGVDQIEISIISDEDTPFELKGLSIEYSILKQKRGATY